MAAPYTSPSISGYNSNPPSDDGSQTEANRVKWATITGKLAGPLKTFAEAVSTAVSTAFGKVPGGAGVVSTGISRTGVASDQGKTVVATAAGITITTPDATSVESPFGFHFVNTSAGTVTFDGNGSQTIDGVASITVPAKRGFWVETDGSNWFTGGQNFDLVPQLPRGYIGGLQLTQPLTSGVPDDHDITIAVGECRASDNTANLSLSSTLTKQIDASWATGDEAGGMASGVSLSPDTWYHLFLVDDGSGGTDAVFDTDIDCTNGLATTGIGTVYRRIGSVLTDSSSNIIPFDQNGDEFLWDTPPLDHDGSGSTSGSLITLSVPPDVKVNAFGNFITACDNVYLSSPDQDDQAPSSTAAPLSTSKVGDSSHTIGNVWGPTRTNTSSQIRERCSEATTLDIVTLGWADRLGRWD